MAVEREEYIGSDINVIVSENHSFGTDAVLLADFAAVKNKERACDFGTGCGIIPLIWCRNNTSAHITAVEIQKDACNLFEKSIELNGLNDKITVVNHDIKDIKSIIGHGSFEVVTMNPPYKADGAGIQSSTKQSRIARHETECTIDDIASSAAYVLNFSGRLCMCNRPERLCDTITAMKNSGIEPKRLRFVVKNASSKPWLFLIEGRKGGKPFLNVEPMLIMYDENGETTDEVKRIYGDYKGSNK